METSVRVPGRVPGAVPTAPSFASFPARFARPLDGLGARRAPRARPPARSSREASASDVSPIPNILSAPSSSRAASRFIAAAASTMNTSNATGAPPAPYPEPHPGRRMPPVLRLVLVARVRHRPPRPRVRSGPLRGLPPLLLLLGRSDLRGAVRRRGIADRAPRETPPRSGPRFCSRRSASSRTTSSPPRWRASRGG